MPKTKFKPLVGEERDKALRRVKELPSEIEAAEKVDVAECERKLTILGARLASKRKGAKYKPIVGEKRKQAIDTVAQLRSEQDSLPVHPDDPNLDPAMRKASRRASTGGSLGVSLRKSSSHAAMQQQLTPGPPGGAAPGAIPTRRASVSGAAPVTSRRASTFSGT